MELIESRYQIHQGEALRWLMSLPDASCEALITDPPYSSGGMYRGDRVATTASKYVQGQHALTWLDFAGDNRDGRGWDYWCTLWLSEAMRVVKPEGYVLMFTDWRQLPNATDALQAGGWIWRGIIVWDKTRAARAPHCGYFRHQSEFVVWGTRGGIPQTGGPWDGVITQPVLQSDKHHMTGKPTKVMEALVQVAPAGGTVLDPFMGSGTTGVAALKHGRCFLGCEIVPEIYETAARRLAATDMEMVGYPMDAPLFEVVA